MSEEPTMNTRSAVGPVAAIVVSLSNCLALVLPTSDDGSDGPPFVVVAFGAAVGLVMAGLIFWGWRADRRGPIRAGSVLMVLVALTAVPAFTTPDVPAWAQLFAGIYILLTIGSLILLFGGARRPQAAVR
jgi:hypothetical protein